MKKTTPEYREECASVVQAFRARLKALDATLAEKISRLQASHRANVREARSEAEERLTRVAVEHGFSRASEHHVALLAANRRKPAPSRHSPAPVNTPGGRVIHAVVERAIGAGAPVVVEMARPAARLVDAPHTFAPVPARIAALQSVAEYDRKVNAFLDARAKAIARLNLGTGDISVAQADRVKKIALQAYAACK